MDLCRHGHFLLGPAYRDTPWEQGGVLVSHLSPSSFALSLCPEFLVHPAMSMSICMDGRGHACVQRVGSGGRGRRGLHVLHRGQAP